MTDTKRWTVRDPETGMNGTVEATHVESAQAAAWRSWYGREPASELEALMRAALEATPAHEGA